MNKAMIFDVEHGSFVDGPGIRTTVFFKGCNLKCAWCHNPEGQDFAQQLLFYQDKCTACGKCKAVCPHHGENCDFCGKCTRYCPGDARKVCGREYTVAELLPQLLADKAFYDNSGGGVTFSGGECMLQIDFLGEILKKCKEKGIHTAVDTAGAVPFREFEKILPYTDLFLYDIKLLDSEKHKRFTGLDNRLILDNLQKLFALGAKIRIRIPVIGGVNDSPEELEAIKAFLDTCGTPEKVELLPYHPMGESKRAALGQVPRCFSTPDPEKFKQLEAIFA